MNGVGDEAVCVSVRLHVRNYYSSATIILIVVLCCFVKLQLTFKTNIATLCLTNTLTQTCGNQNTKCNKRPVIDFLAVVCLWSRMPIQKKTLIFIQNKNMQVTKKRESYSKGKIDLQA